MSDFSGQVTHLEWSATPLWLIPLFPFLGAATNALFGRRLQASDVGKDLSKRWHIGSFGVSAVAVGAMLAAFAVVVANWVRLLGLEPGNRYLYSHAWQMVRIGSLDVNFSFAMDPLSALMCLIITGVGTLIHIYAVSYMETEPAFWRFFTYLNLFVFSMLLLVLGDNFIVMFFGWEGVGLCSYLLIGFWYKDYKKATAGMKAFVVNRVGDWGVICGLGLLFWGMGGAWTEQGRYRPDFRARFVAVEAEAYADAEEAEEHGGAEHGGAEHAKPAAPAAGEHGKAEEGHHGVQGAHGEHGARTATPVTMGDTPKPPAVGVDAPKKREVGVKGRPPASGSKGTLTMTTDPGARVYLGVDTMAALGARSANACPADGPLASGCYITSPFLRKEIPTGVHNITIIPGDGAVVARRRARGRPPPRRRRRARGGRGRRQRRAHPHLPRAARPARHEGPRRPRLPQGCAHPEDDLGGHGPHHPGLPPPLRRRHRQERAAPALRLAARRHGGSNTRLRAHPRGDHGDGRRLLARPAQLPLLAEPHGLRRGAPSPGPPPRSSRPPSASSSTTSRRCWPTAR